MVKGNEKKIVVFSISVRESTRNAVDQMAFATNRSRSNLIDLACAEYVKNNKTKSNGQ